MTAGTAFILALAIYVACNLVLSHYRRKEEQKRRAQLIKDIEDYKRREALKWLVEDAQELDIYDKN